jgi:hypothetical protein
MEAIVLAKTAANNFAETRDYLTEVRDLPVTTDDEQEFAAEGLRWVKEQHAAVEAKRTSITKPLNAALKEVNDLFRPMKTAFEEVERILKKRIAGYLEKKEADNVRAIEAAAVATTSAEATMALSTVRAVEAPTGVSMRYRWVFEVTDASLVPREFLEPAMWKIGRAVQDSDGQRQIPGVRAYKEPIVTSRKLG